MGAGHDVGEVHIGQGEDHVVMRRRMCRRAGFVGLSREALDLPLRAGQWVAFGYSLSSAANLRVCLTIPQGPPTDSVSKSCRVLGAANESRTVRGCSTSTRRRGSS